MNSNFRNSPDNFSIVSTGLPFSDPIGEMGLALILIFIVVDGDIDPGETDFGETDPGETAPVLTPIGIFFDDVCVTIFEYFI